MGINKLAKGYGFVGFKTELSYETEKNKYTYV